MPRKHVKLFISFVSASPGSKPSPVIENPIDVYDTTGYVKDYDGLLAVVGDLVETKHYGLFFHKDIQNEYTFDGTSFSSGAIYGRRTMRKDGEEMADRVTARNLVPIQSNDAFRRAVDESGVVVYRKPVVSRSGRLPKATSKIKRRQVECVIIELCVILTKRKVVVKDTPRVVTVQTVQCNQSSGSISNASETVRKRKQEGFVFKARDLSVTLYAPIEVLERPTSKVTCVPPGKTNKQFVFNLDRFIVSGNEDGVDETSEDIDGRDESEEDEYFVSMFTLSRFRKDVMMVAMELFPEEYSLESKSLGPRCKLFCQRQWNSASWTEIQDTDTFVRLLVDQMAVKARMNKDVLSIRFAFGRAKQGLEFKDRDEFEEYTKVFGGESESLLFSKNKDATSPYIRRFGDAKRSKNWAQPTQITTFITNLYINHECKLYYGFMREHANAFFRIISANVAHKKDASPFKPFIEDPTSLPSDIIIDQHLLSVYVASFSNDVSGYAPETLKYPPTNEDMLKIPPSLRDWKRSQQSAQITPLPTSSSTILPSQLPSTVTMAEGVDEIIVITFVNGRDDSEISVMIEGELNNSSTLEAVMKDGDIGNEFGLENIVLGEGEQMTTPTSHDVCTNYKFCIKRNNSTFISFRWNKFRYMTVGSMLRIKNIHDDYVIDIS